MVEMLDITILNRYRKEWLWRASELSCKTVKRLIRSGNCLVTRFIDKGGRESTDYYHKVLEAKNILFDSLVISVGTEFIKNKHEDTEK